MSIQSEIERLETAKSNIASAIAEKGVTVPDGATLSDMADLIKEIETVTYTLSISGRTIKLNGSDGSTSSVTVPVPYAKIPFDTWEGYLTTNSGSVSSAGWYCVQKVPGSGVLVKCESSWNHSSERTLFSVNDSGEQIYIWFDNSKVLKSAKYSNGAWTDVNISIYYYKLS